MAFPTETVYGLGGNALDEHAAKKIYAAKGRPQDNPLIVHIHSTSQLDKLVYDIPPGAAKLMDRFWPGPLTIIFPKKTLYLLELLEGWIQWLYECLPILSLLA